MSVAAGTSAAPAKPFARRAILIALSAGGFSPLQEILGNLPASLQAAVVVVSHRSSQPPYLLARILSRSTALRVKDVEEGEPMQCGTVYLAPPDRHLAVAPDQTFSLSDGRRISYVRSSANPLFESAGRFLGPNAIAVVLSGTGADGTDGVQAVKSAGGTVIVQDRASARYFAMPSAAIATGAVDLVLPAREIAPTLLRLLGASPEGAHAAS
jgi:two-component system, chemotaxis family, protein-glutamate methylesterase/glutaminase